MEPTNFKLDVDRNNLNIPDSFVAQFGDFRTFRHVPVVDEGVITIRREPEYLLQHRIKRGPANEKAVLANAGLVLHLVRLAQHGDTQLRFRRMYGEVEARMYRSAPHFDVANAKTLYLGAAYDADWLALVLNEKRACIQLGRDVRESWLIAQLCLAWPQTKVLVLGTHEPALQRLVDDLEEERVKRALPHIPVHRPPLVVPQSGITFSTWVDTKQIEFERGYDFVIVPDATQVEHQNARWPLSGIDARLGVFGFIRETSRLAPRTKAYVSAAFGPIGLDIPRHGMTKPHIQVAWLTINKGRLTTRGERRPNLFRDGIEGHRHRNEKIIRLAKALASGDTNELKQFECVFRWWEAGGGGRLQVLVACASARQARALRKLASIGQIVTDSPEDQAVLASQPWTGPPGIRFSVSRRKHTTRGFDVVINAAGGTVPSHLCVQLAPQDGATRRSMLVVDLRDRHHPLLEKWAKKREKWYKDHRYYDVGVGEIEGQLDDFIKRYHTMEAST